MIKINEHQKYAIKVLYDKQQVLYRERDEINRKINVYRKAMTGLISDTYWDLNNRLVDIEKEIGIPYNKLNLYAVKDKKFKKHCRLCGKLFEFTVSARTSVDCKETCSLKCSEELYNRNYGEIEDEDFCPVCGHDWDD